MWLIDFAVFAVIRWRCWPQCSLKASILLCFAFVWFNKSQNNNLHSFKLTVYKLKRIEEARFNFLRKMSFSVFPVRWLRQEKEEKKKPFGISSNFRKTSLTQVFHILCMCTNDWHRFSVDEIHAALVQVQIEIILQCVYCSFQCLFLKQFSFVGASVFFSLLFLLVSFNHIIITPLGTNKIFEKKKKQIQSLYGLLSLRDGRCVIRRWRKSYKIVQHNLDENSLVFMGATEKIILF